MNHDAYLSADLQNLCERLNLRRYEVAGHLEFLWHFTASEAPQGNIGKLSNEDIAQAMAYKGNPDKLIAALVECHWLAPSEQFRLVIDHDWHEEDPNDPLDMGLHAALRASGLGFDVSR